MDSGRTPGRVVRDHLPDEPSDLGIQTLPPPGEALKGEGPEGSVTRSKGKTGWPRPQEDAELMPQGEVLGHECGPRAKEGDEGPQEESNQAEHDERIRAKKSQRRPVRGAQEPQSAEVRTPPFGDLMGFWRGTGASAS